MKYTFFVLVLSSITTIISQNTPIIPLIKKTIKIDGVLDESVWAEKDVFSWACRARKSKVSLKFWGFVMGKYPKM